MTRQSKASRRRFTMARPYTADRRLHQRRWYGETKQGWSDLPEGPLHTILTSISSLVDFISFSSVCRSWRAVASSLSSSQKASLFPPLLLCPTISPSRLICSLRLHDPNSPSFSSSLSRISKKIAPIVSFSYSHGHLLYLSQNRVVVLNPFTGHEFRSACLPKLEPHEIFSPPLQLTWPLSSPDSGILLFSSSSSFYWRIGSPSWSCHYSIRIQPVNGMTVVSMQGNVYYAMDNISRTLHALELSPKLHLRPLAIEGISAKDINIWHSLVDCGGELLRVQLVSTEKMCAQLEVFGLDLSGNKMRWVKKESLGNWAIFAGCNRGVPGIVVENPERWGGRSNFVYFATRNANGDSPWAAIKLGDRIDMWKPESPLHIDNFRHQLSSTWVRPGF